MKIIDTNDYDTIEEFEILKRDLEDELYIKRKYDISDFALVRTTNFLEEDHVLKALCKIPFVINTNNVPFSTMHEILRNKYNINVYDEIEDEKLRLLVGKYSPLSTQYRSTIHFTLNGLVSNHSMGIFNNNNFIIIDRLDKHLGIDDFRSIRMEDTFVYGEFSISDSAIILIDAEKYPKLLKEYVWLDTYKNIVLFRGDEKKATQILLVQMGIIPENIGAHSADYTKRTPMQQEYFKNLKEKFGIEQVKHCYSNEYIADDEKNLLLWEMYDNRFYNALFTHFNIDDVRKDQMLEYLLSYKYSRLQQQELLKNFIFEVGLENYQEFVLNYNKQILNEIANNNYPTNDEIIEKGFIFFKSDVASMKK